MHAIVDIMVARGLGAKGYRWINVDEGWLESRNATGQIVENRTKFPEGMKGFGDYVRSTQRAPGQNFEYGLYTSRGTCQCSEADYHGPGSQGHEAVRCVIHVCMLSLSCYDPKCHYIQYNVAHHLLVDTG